VKLEVKNIGKHFGGVQALNNVSLVVDKPELMGLIGPNGAGKTTLANVLDGVHKPNEGEVWLMANVSTACLPIRSPGEDWDAHFR
jgi:ABC-type branched-subunit amino acid transport system ATPase component